MSFFTLSPASASRSAFLFFLYHSMPVCVRSVTPHPMHVSSRCRAFSLQMALAFALPQVYYYLPFFPVLVADCLCKTIVFVFSKRR